MPLFTPTPQCALHHDFEHIIMFATSFCTIAAGGSVLLHKMIHTHWTKTWFQVSKETSPQRAKLLSKMHYIPHITYRFPASRYSKEKNLEATASNLMSYKIAESLVHKHRRVVKLALLEVVHWKKHVYIYIYMLGSGNPPSPPRDGHGPSHPPPPVVVVWCYGGGGRCRRRSRSSSSSP